MTRGVQLLLKDRNRELYSAARSKLKRGIRDAKAAYRRRIEGHFEDSNPRRAWQGIRQITNYKNSTNQNTSSSAPLADQLNHFFSRFEVVSTEPATPIATVSASISQPLNIQTADVIQLTVPWENSVEEAYEHKNLRYTELAAWLECQSLPSRSGMQRICGFFHHQTAEMVPAVASALR
ncbi:hypothetical protein AAFF_G00345100 [Aldrovandia affinis]|uniref:Uncharacterized protein n=1 Tax=Aldrovandia affinis TaxID=143900 RepID=A0AAD7R630_9TELE|nr:hypothetical protein AAFF_G00345100 [Aldrovandia affinis]